MNICETCGKAKILPTSDARICYDCWQESDAFKAPEDRSTHFPMKWEKCDDSTERAKVFGGWMLLTTTGVTYIVNGNMPSDGYDWRIATLFIADPNHEWTV